MELHVVENSVSLTHIALVGSLNLAGVQKIEMSFLAHTAAAQKPAIVDVSAVDFIASLGLRMFVDAARTLKRCGHSLIILRPVFDVETVLKMSGIDMLILILHSEEEARVHILTAS